jgi:flagellar biogenesis protein FliO
VVAIILQAIFYPVLLVSGGQLVFGFGVFFVFVFQVNYVFFPLLFGIPLILALVLVFVLLHRHLRSTGFPGPKAATVLLLSAALLGVFHTLSAGASRWEGSNAAAVAWVCIYTLTVAFGLILFRFYLGSYPIGAMALTMVGAITLVAVVSWGAARMTHENELDRRVQQHPGYDQMSPVDQDMLRQQYERGEEPGRIAPQPG